MSSLFTKQPSNKKIVDPEEYILNDKTHEVTLFNKIYCEHIFSMRWNLYFQSLYGVNIGFEITPRSQPYFTPLDCRRHLNIVLQPLFPHRPIVVDLTCGIGGDLADFILNWDAEKYYGVDNMPPEEFTVLHSNMKKIVDVPAFKDDFPGGSEELIKIANDGGDGSEWEAKISLHQKTASKFLKDYGAHLKREGKKELPPILIYADPTWNAQRLINATFQQQVDEQAQRDVEKQKADAEKNGGNGTDDDTSDSKPTEPKTVSDNTADSLENEGTPEVIMDYIIKCILLPLREAEIPCNIFCVKVRWDITQKKMQDYLNKYDQLKDHFVVLYSVQAIANVPGKKLHTEEDEGNFKSVIYDEGGHMKRNKENFGAVKGIFHWIIMKRIDYMYVHHERTELYEEECIKSEPVYIKRGSFLRPFKPRYSDHMPLPTIKTRKEFSQLETTEEKDQYVKIGPAKTWDEVKQIDLANYISELTQLKVQYTRVVNDEMKRSAKQKIEEIFVLCNEYVTGEDNLEKAQEALDEANEKWKQKKTDNKKPYHIKMLELGVDIAKKILALKELVRSLHELVGGQQSKGNPRTYEDKRPQSARTQTDPKSTAGRSTTGRPKSARDGSNWRTAGRSTTGRPNSARDGDWRNAGKRSHLDTSTLELLHQLKVIFET
jgi:hypothetical protein